MSSIRTSVMAAPIILLALLWPLSSPAPMAAAAIPRFLTATSSSWISLTANTASSSATLPDDADMLSCGPSGCTIVTPANMSSLCKAYETIIVYDTAACLHAAMAIAGYRQPLSSASGVATAANTAFCQRTLHLLARTGHTYLVTASPARAEACVVQGRAGGVEHLLVAYNGWEALAGDDTFGHTARRIRQPFREECLIKLTSDGCSQPCELWPGDLRYYVSPWPTRDNFYTLIERTSNCPVMHGYRPVGLPRYGIVYGKISSLLTAANSGSSAVTPMDGSSPLVLDADFWRALRSKVHVVVLDCGDGPDHAALMRWGAEHRWDFTCWNLSPLRKVVSIDNLVFDAAFVLGLGDSSASPLTTPVDLMSCRTPVIAPASHSKVLLQYTIGREFYPAASGADMLRAVDDILGDCEVRVAPVDGEAKGTVRKSNSCFREPSKFEALYDEEAKLVKELDEMLFARKVLCYEGQPAMQALLLEQ